jgi:hypothetical protein
VSARTRRRPSLPSRLCLIASPERWAMKEERREDQSRHAAAHPHLCLAISPGGGQEEGLSDNDFLVFTFSILLPTSPLPPTPPSLKSAATEPPPPHPLPLPQPSIPTPIPLRAHDPLPAIGAPPSPLPPLPGQLRRAQNVGITRPPRRGPAQGEV